MLIDHRFAIGRTWVYIRSNVHNLEHLPPKAGPESSGRRLAGYPRPLHAPTPLLACCLPKRRLA